MQTTCAACGASILLLRRSGSGSLAALEENDAGSYIVIDGQAYSPCSVVQPLLEILGDLKKYADHLDTCKARSQVKVAE